MHVIIDSNLHPMLAVKEDDCFQLGHLVLCEWDVENNTFGVHYVILFIDIDVLELFFDTPKGHQAFSRIRSHHSFSPHLGQIISMLRISVSDITHLVRRTSRKLTRTGD